VFPDNWYEKGEYGDGEMSGVYDLEGPGRSVLNKLNTNYSGFCVLLVDVNQVLRKGGREPIKLVGVTPFNQIIETKKFIEVLKEYQFRIFNRESSTFQNIMRILEQTNSWGEKREDDTITKLEKKFGVDNVTKLGKLGGEVDMVNGVDAEITIDDVIFTSQIKPFSYITDKDNEITIHNSGNVKPYKTHWLIFTNKKQTLIFDNSNTRIVGGSYVFPSEDLIYTL
jgi:hypothetical protein